MSLAPSSFSKGTRRAKQGRSEVLVRPRVEEQYRHLEGVCVARYHRTEPPQTDDPEGAPAQLQATEAVAVP